MGNMFEPAGLPDNSEAFERCLEREKRLISELGLCADARRNLQIEIAEQEQEIADLRKELAMTKKALFEAANNLDSNGIPIKDSLIATYTLSSTWHRLDNFIKRLARK